MCLEDRELGSGRLTEVPSFQGVKIEEFHHVYRGVLISGCWNRGVPLHTEVPSFQGVGVEEFHHVYRGVLISGCWNRGVPLYTEVSSFQGIGIEEFHCTQGCPHLRVLE